MVKTKILNYFFYYFFKASAQKVDEENVIWVYKHDVYRKII